MTGRKSVPYIQGEGIGPEIIAAAIRVVEATGAPVDFFEAPLGSGHGEQLGIAISGELLSAIRNAKACLKGPLANPIGTGPRSRNHVLREKLGLYVSVRPFATYEGLRGPFSKIDLDMTVLMHNMEAPGGGIDRLLGADQEIAEHITITTMPATKLFLRYAFNYARTRRQRLAVIHFADQMKCSEGLWVRAAAELHGEFPEVELEDYLADDIAQKLVKKPQHFKIVAGSHQWGNVFSGLCAGLVGGVGLSPAINLGEGDIGLFETSHGTAPDIAGMNVANPTAAILAGKYLLEHLGFGEEATRIDRALRETFADGRVLTRDLGGHASTDSFADQLIKVLQ